jgi:hypothetical protein
MKRDTIVWPHMFADAPKPAFFSKFEYLNNILQRTYISNLLDRYFLFVLIFILGFDSSYIRTNKFNERIITHKMMSMYFTIRFIIRKKNYFKWKTKQHINFECVSYPCLKCLSSVSFHYNLINLIVLKQHNIIFWSVYENRISYKNRIQMSTFVFSISYRYHFFNNKL